MEDITPADLLAMLRRQRRLALTVFAIVAALTLAFVSQWSHYKASVTVQISNPYIPSSLATVGSVEANEVTLGLADRRISQIYQQIIATESLSEIIHNLNLYPDRDAEDARETTAETMRRHLSMTFKPGLIISPVAAQKETVEQLSAPALTLTFTHHDPQLAKQALDTVAERLIAAERAEREARHRDTIEFLDDEIGTMEASIAQQEKEIAEFRATQGESGPAALSFQQQASLSSSVNLQSTLTQIATLQSTIASLNAQLAITDPHLSVMENGKQVPTPMAQRKMLETQLASLTGRYGDQHPDIVAIRQQLKTLGAVKPGKQAVRPDNPVYLQLQTQLAGARAQLATIESQRASLQTEKTNYDTMLARQPQLEERMARLTLDLDHAKERHRALKDKRLAADMRAKMDQGEQSTRLKITQPSAVPTQTTPPRILILLGGLFIALFCALASVILAEILAQHVRGPDHLYSVTGAAPLVSIPRISSIARGAP